MQIFTDATHRIAYATDASAYREIPLGVAYPQTEEDIRWLMNEAKRRNTCLIPRAGGTSIAGQVVGKGIVVDVSKYMNRVLRIDADKRLAVVQPGVVRDELNIALKPYGLFFSPETSTSNRCCIGGMIGNNSCGTHSLVYGSTRHHVVALKVMLTDGTVHLFTVDGHGEEHQESSVWENLQSLLTTWQQDEYTTRLIRDNFPDTAIRRRSCGYAIDECLRLWDAEADECVGFNMPALITGSEGTLAFVLEATLSLDVLPAKEKALVCAHVNNLNDSWDINLIALEHHPYAVELLDGKILELCKGNIEADRDRFFVKGDPAAIVITEFCASTTDELNQQIAAYETSLQTKGHSVYAVTRVYGKDVERVWSLRKAGLGVLSTMHGEAKPIGVIEDTAIAPYRMGDYMKDFQQMLVDLGLDCVYYGHISTGELHLRPILDIKKKEDRILFRRIAHETALLVKKHRGCLSGEHGDGRLRGEFIPIMYGDEVYNLMRALKNVCDGEGIMNKGKIVDTFPMDEYLRYDLNQSYLIGKFIDNSTSMMQQIERCNGSGDCRKSNIIGGTMCPTFKLLKDETYSTRSRANIFREVLTRGTLDASERKQSLKELLSDESLNHALSTCLSCKACKSECPSNVDIAKIRSEILHLQNKTFGVSMQNALIVLLPWITKIGSYIPHVYNWVTSNKWTSFIIKKCMRFAVERHLPTVSIRTMRKLCQQEPQPHTNKKVYVFADEFTNYQEAELGLTFVRLLVSLGYEVEIPKHVESGRAAISKGCLGLATKYAEKNVRLLKDIVTDDTPLIGIEPSCILTFRDEYIHLVSEPLQEDAKRLAKNCLLYDEWLVREFKMGRISAEVFDSLPAHIWLHGHCNQKALVGIEHTATLLNMIPDACLHVIPSGCCGMAGSFGYEKKNFETSMAIGNMVLFPTIRQAYKDSEPDANTFVCAPGTSCRQQIKEGTGINAYHPIEILYKALRTRNTKNEFL